MKNNFIYTVKVGRKLKGGGANGLFTIYQVTKTSVNEVGYFVANIVTLPPNYIGVVPKWLKSKGHKNIGYTQRILEY